MQDYMRALRQRFSQAKESADKSQEREELLTALRRNMDKPERKLLLRLLDLESSLRDESCLYSFINGYRLASGINRELSDEPPYSFDSEEEEKAKTILISEMEET